MPLTPERAVFLSYASQDAEPAQRICDALRAAGVEVWFDQSELTGGDAWDQKIRAQIKACALFLPVISAATQARREGYFRIEWKLAAQRTHALADGTPFLLPIVIDATKDGEALVPEEFRAVQWTRLPGGTTPPAFCARVGKLLGSEDSSAGAPLDDARGALAPDGRRAAPLQVRSRPWFVGGILGITVVAGLTAWQLGWRGEKAKPAESPAGAGMTAMPATSEAERLVERARPHYQGIFTRADLALAEELGRRAAELEPTLARAWAVRAAAESCYLMRGFAAGESAQQRARNAQIFANQALALDRDEPEALIALGQVAIFQNAPAQAEAFYRRVLTRDADNPFARRYLSIVLRTTGRVPAAIALMEEAVRRMPGDVLTHFDLAVAYAYHWDWPRAWAQAEAALALQPFPGAQMLKVRLAFQWKGDLVLMRKLLEEIDVTYRGEDDAVLWDMRCGLFERRPDRVLEAAGRTTRTYLEETFIFPGPKAWFPARAYQLAGKEGLARQQWQAAESVLRERLKADPQNLELRLKLAVTLAWLQEKDEARRELAAIESAWREQLNPDRAWDLASFHAASGDASAAVPLLRMALHAGTGIAPLTLNHLRFDPWWDQIRETPEFQSLLTNPPPLPAVVTVTPPDAAGAPEQKSVAVLAFKNLSGDPAREFFSDGLSEAVSDVLGRVPGLKVVSSASAFSFKGKSVPTPEIARQLGVTHLVEGTVMQEGQTVRITAKLIKADGFQVWVSDKLDRELKNIFALHDEVAGLIATNLSLKLGASSAPSRAAVNPRAFELYLQARQAWNLRTLEGYDLAESALTRALALEPHFARAHAALADVWSQRFFRNRASEADNSAEHARIRAKITQALTLDPDSAEAHASLGFVLWQDGKNLDAEAALLRAVSFNPNYASSHLWLGRVLLNHAKVDLALEHLKLATELDPLAPIIWHIYGYGLSCAARRAQGLMAYDRALTLQPDYQSVLQEKAIVLVELGRFTEAVALARRLLTNHGAAARTQLQVFARSGLVAEAEALLADPSSRANNPRWRPISFLALGRTEEAMALMTPNGINLVGASSYLWDPIFDPVRNDPRWVKLMAEAGLTEAHARAQAWRKANPPEKPATK